MLPVESAIPQALADYMEGLKTHDIELIGSTFAEHIRFVTPARTIGRVQILEFLTALYRGFPDWTYRHDEPVKIDDEKFAVKWRQSGTHTGRLEFSGFLPVEPTHRFVRIPEHFFYYAVVNNKLTEIRPDPIPGGAPRGIFQQIGVEIPPL